MADYIDREELLKRYGLNEATKYGNETAEQQANSYSTMMLYEIADMIDDMPSVDAVEVVRCKDCKYYNNGYCKKLEKETNETLFQVRVKENEFCSDGEQK